MDGETLATTTSLCPTCLERVPGRYEASDDRVYLTRECPDHGVASRKVWGSRDHWEWAAEHGVDQESASQSSVEGDHAGGGDLTVDGDHACLAVVEVTEDCNLSCSFCFAASGPGGDHRPFEEVLALLEVVEAEGGHRPIQFSGGEPTVRDDLPELVERAREMGFGHVEVNTNGLRLAREDGYAEGLVAAGVTAAYLQFDGLEGATYEAIRGVDLAAEKRAALAACERAGLPVILVPTVVPGVNDHELGDLVRFALEHREVVRSVNVQPVAHVGRYATRGERFSLDEAARRLAAQVDALEPRDLLPVPCCSSYCQLATAVVAGEDGPVPLTRFLDEDAWADVSGTIDEADWMELLAGTPAAEETACCVSGCWGPGLSAAGSDLLDEVVPVTVTGFMDADAADDERLRNCCLSVPTAEDGLVPFCAYNMTTEDGRYAIRNRRGWGGRDGVGPDTELPARGGAPGDRSGSGTLDRAGPAPDEPAEE